MGGSYLRRLILTGVIIIGAVGGGLWLKGYLIPPSFGIYGEYRADAIDIEAQLPIRHGTNAACAQCHRWEGKALAKGLHKSVSCEFCHGILADHIAHGKKTGILPVKKGGDMVTLCLRCHNTEIRARDEAVIKTVALPDHLTEQKVKPDHVCNQCHYVHAPMKYIHRARKIAGEEVF